MESKLCIPPRYLACTFENYQGDIKQVPDAAWLMGPSGTGKTHLLAAKVKELAERGEPVRYWRLVDWIEEVRTAIMDNDYSSRSVTDHFSSRRYLVLDDLAVLNVKPFVLEVLYKVIDYRWNYNLPMLVASDREPDALAKLLDDRIISRLAGICEIIRTGGKDRRIYQGA